MTKVSIALAGLLFLAAATPDVAFAAIGASQAAIARGQAIDECRAQTEPTMNDHHARPARDACVQRLMHANQPTF